MGKDKISIDNWVLSINNIYERNNCERSFKDIIAFFYEDIGRCFQLINRKREAEIEKLLPSIFKWFCILYAKYNNQKITISDILWNKFQEYVHIVEKNLPMPYRQRTTEC